MILYHYNRIARDMLYKNDKNAHGGTAVVVMRRSGWRERVKKIHAAKAGSCAAEISTQT